MRNGNKFGSNMNTYFGVSDYNFLREILGTMLAFRSCMSYLSKMIYNLKYVIIFNNEMATKLKTQY